MNIRFPFSDIIGTRDTRLNKDSLTTNVFFDAVPEGEALVKRPGLANLTSALGLGINGQLGFGQGIFYYEDQVFSFNSPPLGFSYNQFAVGTEQVCLLASPPGASPPETQSFVVVINGDESLEVSNLPSYLTNAMGILYTGTHFCIYGTNYPTGDVYIIRSVDGLVWEQVYTSTTGFAISFASAKEGRSIFISQAFTTVTHSIDNGATWTVDTTNIDTPDEVNCLVNNGTNFTNGRHYSSDGITWTASTGEDVTGSFIIWGENKFYTYAFPGQSSEFVAATSSTGAVWAEEVTTGGYPTSTSTRGQVWSVYGSLPDNYTTLNAIADVETDPKNYYSTNGLDWVLGGTRQTYNNSLDNRQIFYFNGFYYGLSVILADLFVDPYDLWFIEKSEDGINWESYAIDIALFDPTPTIIDGLI